MRENLEKKMNSEIEVGLEKERGLMGWKWVMHSKFFEGGEYSVVIGEI